MSSKPAKKMKWTDQMNRDVLACKRKAIEMVSSANPPRKDDGKKKGYIELLKQLWDESGYLHLGMKAQNLRDQAARLEKLQESSLITTKDKSLDEVSLRDYNSDNNQNNDDQEIQNANFSSVSTPDLHTPTLQVPEEQSVEEQNDEINEIFSMELPGSLPEFISVDTPQTIVWSQSPEKEIIINSSTIEKAYNEITIWRKNSFLVPYGKTGKDFIDQLTKLINDWNNRSERQHVALKAFMVLLALGLQKPSKKSKAKDHQECLEKRLAQWKEGKIEELLREGRSIQKRLVKYHQNKGTSSPNKAKIFAKLVMEGQINSALRYLTDNNGGGVLPLTDDVMEQLQYKHPKAQPAKMGSLLFGPVEDVHETVYSEITGEMVREGALKTKGAGGPSGVDAVGFKRILACKSFKKSSTSLCDAVAAMTRRLCTEYVDPLTVEPLLANRLIPLDKGEGQVRPIGVGEVLRRVIAKCVTKVLKEDVLEASGPLQLCAGHKSGSEAGIHAMHNLFEADESDTVLLIDATNAFNSLNRAAALHNVRILCPTLAKFAINTYRVPTRLFITGGKELSSAEGTTQGDPLAMSFYAISLQPLITHLNVSSDASQCWFADDATAVGRIEELKEWWDELNDVGSSLGYFPNAKKCWLITKSEKEETARNIFADTSVNVSSQGQRHLGAILGAREYLEEYVNGKVEEWISEVVKLSEFAETEPQASYAAFTFGLKHRWTYFLRTLPDIEDLLIPLEKAIADILIPSITGYTCTPEERDLLSLPVRLGGLGFTNPCQVATAQYKASIKVTTPLVQKIMSQEQTLPDPEETKTLQQTVRKEKDDCLKEKLEEVKRSLSAKTNRAVELAGEKGASSWLNVLPVKDMNFALNKREFMDAIKLRYDWPIPECPSICVCGANFTVDHAMVCKHGGFVIQRHNELRDLEAELLEMVCSDVQIEPSLQPITGETLNRGANKDDGARVDIHARGFWERQRSAFFDVRVCHPNADSYKEMNPQQIYKQHETEKKRQYATRILEIEHGTFTPLVYTTTGGMSEECKRFHSRLAELISIKKGETYAATMQWIRTKVSFAILRGALLCLRGTRSSIKRRFVNIVHNDLSIENCWLRHDID